MVPNSKHIKSAKWTLTCHNDSNFKRRSVTTESRHRINAVMSTGGKSLLIVMVISMPYLLSLIPSGVAAMDIVPGQRKMRDIENGRGKSSIRQLLLLQGNSKIFPAPLLGSSSSVIENGKFCACSISRSLCIQ